EAIGNMPDRRLGHRLAALADVDTTRALNIDADLLDVLRPELFEGQIQKLDLGFEGQARHPEDAVPDRGRHLECHLPILDGEGAKVGPLGMLWAPSNYHRNLSASKVAEVDRQLAIAWNLHEPRRFDGAVEKQFLGE